MLQFDEDQYKIDGQLFPSYPTLEDLNIVTEYVCEGEPKKETVAWMCNEYVKEATQHIMSLDTTEAFKAGQTRMSTGIKAVCPAALSKLADFINKRFPETTEEYKHLLFALNFEKLRQTCLEVSKNIQMSEHPILGLFSKLGGL